MENKKREIAKFYKQIFSDIKLKERIVKKVKKIATEEDLKKLIQQEIVPLMKKYNVNFSEKELLEYEEETLKKLSKEDLDSVSGGTLIKPVAIGALSALALACGVGVASLSASADSGKGVLVQNAGNGQQQSDGNEEEEEEEANISENDNDEAHQIIASGNCGLEGDEESVRWEFRKDGTITIVDDGLIKDYSLSKLRPWSKISRTSDLKISDGPFGPSQFEWPSINDNDEAYQIIASGNCGPEGDEESVRWEVWKDGTLEIWGIGSMKDFSPTDPPPWRLHKDKIRRINIMTTNIGSYAFTGCSEVTSVYISPDVTSIGQYAFANCTKLNYVFFEGKKDLDPNNDKKIFANCPIEEVTVTNDYMGGNTFCGQKVDSFHIPIMPMPISDLGMADEPFGVPYKVSLLPISDLKISDEPFGVPSQIELPPIDLPYMPTQESVETNVPPDFTWKYATFYEPTIYEEPLSPREMSFNKITADEESSYKDITFKTCGHVSDYSAPTDIHMHTSHVLACDSPSIHETHLFKPEIKMPLDKIIAGDLESEGVLWVLRKSGKLEIFGHGLMKNYSDKERPQWEQYKDKIKWVNISGVKSIGDNAFANYKELRLLEISNDVVSIGKNAFNDCNNLSVFVVIPVSVTSIGENAFANCTKLNYVFFEGKNDLDPNNDKKVFANCPIEKIKVTDAYIGGNTFCGKKAIKMKSEANMY